MDPSNAEGIVQFILGCVALVAGRNLFWLFIAVAGFLIGYNMAGIWLADSSPLLQVAAGFAAGLLGVGLAVVYERVAFALAGFYAAAYLAMAMADKAGMAADPTAIAVIAGMIGAVVAALVMDWAIIALSSLVGAAAIVTTLPVLPTIEGLLFIVLTVSGIVWQRNLFVRRGLS